MANLKFLKRAGFPTTPEVGMVLFDTTDSTIKVYNTDKTWSNFAGKLIDASWDSATKTLTLVKQDGSERVIDFSDVASAKALTDLSDKIAALDLAAVGASGSFISSVSQADGQVSASTTAFATSVTAAGVVAPTSKAVNDFVVGKINALDVEEVSSTTSHGVVVAVSETNGKINTPKVTVTPGSVASGNASVVTGGSVYSAIETAKNDLNKAITTAVGSVYKVKGSCVYADLAKKTDAVIGDVWNVTDANGNTPAGTNYVWTGEAWDALGGTIDLSPYAKTADLKNSDAAETGKFVTAVSEANGIVTVSRKALAASDIPSLAISKITNLQTTLDGKALKTTTVNGHALSADVVINGAELNLSADYAAASTYAAPAAGDSLDSAIGKLAKGVADAKASGVTSFGGKTGAITVDGTGTGTYKVALKMSNNQLGASISGLGSAAAKNVADFDAAGAADAVKGDKATDTAASETVYGAIKKAEAAASAASAASDKVDTAIAALDATVDNSATATAAGTADSTQIKVSIVETDGKLNSVSVVAPSFEAAGTATNKINALDVTGNVSTAVKGVTVTVNETDGKVLKPVVAISDGTLSGATTDANLVTGTVVKAYVDKKVADNNTMSWVEFA